MQGFIKSDNAVIHLTGYEKIAILLGEVGPSIAQKIMSGITFTTKQLHSINKAFKNLGEYNPRDKYMVSRELSVLEEFVQYGTRLGIYKEIPPKEKDTPHDSRLDAVTTQKPEVIADLLKHWMDGE